MSYQVSPIHNLDKGIYRVTEGLGSKVRTYPWLLATFLVYTIQQGNYRTMIPLAQLHQTLYPCRRVIAGTRRHDRDWPQLNTTSSCSALFSPSQVCILSRIFVVGSSLRLPGGLGGVDSGLGHDRAQQRMGLIGIHALSGVCSYQTYLDHQRCLQTFVVRWSSPHYSSMFAPSLGVTLEVPQARGCPSILALADMFLLVVSRC